MVPRSNDAKYKGGEIMGESIPGEKTEFAKCKDLRENNFLMKYESSEGPGGEYSKATNLLNFKELGNNIT